MARTPGVLTQKSYCELLRMQKIKYGRGMPRRNGPRIYAEGIVLLDRYQINDIIGSGACGEVYTATDVISREEVALKTARVPKNISEFEMEILKSLRHRSIINIKDSLVNNGLPFIVMPKCDVSLFDIVKRCVIQGPISATVSYEVLSGLEYLHRQKIVHRDIKPANILFTMGMDDEPPRVCITDFGLAKRRVEGVELKGKVGTPRYYAPETFHRYPQNEAVDIWGWGLCVVSMALGDKVDGYEQFLGSVKAEREQTNKGSSDRDCFSAIFAGDERNGSEHAAPQKPVTSLSAQNTGEPPGVRMIDGDLKKGIPGKPKLFENPSGRLQGSMASRVSSIEGLRLQLNKLFVSGNPRSPSSLDRLLKTPSQCSLGPVKADHSCLPKPLVKVDPPAFRKSLAQALISKERNVADHKSPSRPHSAGAWLPTTPDKLSRGSSLGSSGPIRADHSYLPKPLERPDPLMPKKLLPPVPMGKDRNVANFMGLPRLDSIGTSTPRPLLVNKSSNNPKSLVNHTTNKTNTARRNRPCSTEKTISNTLHGSTASSTGNCSIGDWGIPYTKARSSNLVPSQPAGSKNGRESQDGEGPGTSFRRFESPYMDESFHEHDSNCCFLSLVPVPIPEDGSLPMEQNVLEDLSKEEIEFLKLMLQIDPAKRWTAAQLLDHPVMKNRDPLNDLNHILVDVLDEMRK